MAGAYDALIEELQALRGMLDPPQEQIMQVGEKETLPEIQAAKQGIGSVMQNVSLPMTHPKYGEIAAALAGASGAVDAVQDAWAEVTNRAADAMQAIEQAKSTITNVIQGFAS